MTVQKNFKIIAPVNKSVLDAESDAFYIEGIANSGLEDLVGDIVTIDALQSIVDQAPQKNLHLDHESGKENILGRIVASELKDEGAWIKASIINEQKDWLKSYLEQGIAYGLSISGTCDYKEGSYSEIIDWQLTEISLTDTPCDPATMGSVSMSKSFDDLLIKIKKEKEQIMEENNMADEEPKYITEDDAVTLINDAFNEKKEEFLESIRNEIKNEYETALNELKERVDALEKRPAPEDEKPEEEKGLTSAQIKELVDTHIKSIFKGAAKDVNHKYDEHKKVESEEKKTFTAKELAEMGII